MEVWKYEALCKYAYSLIENESIAGLCSVDFAVMALMNSPDSEIVELRKRCKKLINQYRNITNSPLNSFDDKWEHSKNYQSRKIIDEEWVKSRKAQQRKCRIKRESNPEYRAKMLKQRRDLYHKKKQDKKWAEENRLKNKLRARHKTASKISAIWKTLISENQFIKIGMQSA